MEFNTMLEIGLECGFKTVHEAFRNIDLHAMSIFKYSELESEILKLGRLSEAYDKDFLIVDVVGFKVKGE